MTGHFLIFSNSFMNIRVDLLKSLFFSKKIYDNEDFGSIWITLAVNVIKPLHSLYLSLHLRTLFLILVLTIVSRILFTLYVVSIQYAMVFHNFLSCIGLNNRPYTLNVKLSKPSFLIVSQNFLILRKGFFFIIIIQIFLNNSAFVTCSVHLILSILL